MPQPPYQIQQHPHPGAPQGPYQQQALPHTQHSQLHTPTHPQHAPQLPAQPTLPVQTHGHTSPQTPTTATTPTQQTQQQPYLGFGTARYAPPYDPTTDPWRTPSNSPSDTPRDTDDPPHHPQPQTTNPLNTATDPTNPRRPTGSRPHGPPRARQRHARRGRKPTLHPATQSSYDRSHAPWQARECRHQPNSTRVYRNTLG